MLAVPPDTLPHLRLKLRPRPEQEFFRRRQKFFIGEIPPPGFLPPIFSESIIDDRVARDVEGVLTRAHWFVSTNGHTWSLTAKKTTKQTNTNPIPILFEYKRLR